MLLHPSENILMEIIFAGLFFFWRLLLYLYVFSKCANTLDLMAQ